MRFWIASTAAVLITVAVVLSTRGFSSRETEVVIGVTAAVCLLTGVLNLLAGRVVPRGARTRPLDTINFAWLLGITVIAIAFAIMGLITNDDGIAIFGAGAAVVVGAMSALYFRWISRPGRD